jgi:hypothetical protein
MIRVADYVASFINDELVDRIQHMVPIRRLPEFSGEARDTP